ncbi:class I SAM-dependent methyltransferase [Nocardiopsis baichengensis]|uniref:class I SAM-dependent methyltransferase n=1 Tax=Nocardiopsis baichengensis TaxID=280240 RepID=UPI0003469B43|nr:class I SAM-dependent methyltransferase [Nocardiopsis baichengensis]
MESAREAARGYWNRRAEGYDAAMDRMEGLLFGDARRRLCGDARGRTLEVAVGTGRSLGLYPEDTELTGVDLSPGMLDRARARAARLGVQADLREGDAQDLPFPDASFDTVVCALSLCSVQDVEQAVAEMRRVLRPGGRMLLLDHVRPTFWPLLWLMMGVQFLQDRLEPEAGEQMLGRPLPVVREQGLTVEHTVRAKGGLMEMVTARRP